MGARLENLTGNTYGNWIVGNYIGRNKYICTCSLCNRDREIGGYFLKNNKYPKCDCLKDSCNRYGLIDLTNKNFGEWKALEYIGDKKWLCQCSCGRKQIIAGSDLRNGKTRKCKYTHTNGAENKYRDKNDFHELEAGAVNLYDKTFGDWEVQYYVGNSMWRCKCSCGSIKDIKAYSLTSGKSTSCGHSTTSLKDLNNKVFGFWEVLEQGELSDRGYMTWKCICRGCNKTVGYLESYLLTQGITRSCGCRTDEIRRETMMHKYGVRYAAQINTGRSQEQLDALQSKDGLKEFLSDYFGGVKQSLSVSADALGITRGTLKNHLIKLDALDLVDISCSNVSGYEKYLRTLYPTESVNDREVLHGREIDLLYKDAGIGIEFNGNYWHSEEVKGDAFYHQRKTLCALESGIRLIHIFEYEWNDARKRKVLLGMLDGLLGRKELKLIDVSKCTVDITTDNMAKSFISENHVDELCTLCNTHLALKYKSDIIAVMSFRVIDDSVNGYELVRAATRLDVCVAGGYSRMFRAFCNMYNPKEVIAYCNIGKYSLDDLIGIGFKPVKLESPSYVWFSTKSMKVVGYGGEGCCMKDSDDIIKIYDSGRYKFIWRA